MRVTTGAFVLTLALGCATAVPSLAQDADHRGNQPQAQQPVQRYQAQEQRDRDQRPDQDRAQDRDQDRRADQDQDRDRGRMARDESGYYNNKYFQQGWKDGLKHKHKNHKWKNDMDRMAYQAGYAHGERGEKWHKPNKRDHDRDRDHDQH